MRNSGKTFRQLLSENSPRSDESEATPQRAVEQPVFGEFTAQIVRRRRGGTVLEEDVIHLLGDVPAPRRRRGGTILEDDLPASFTPELPVHPASQVEMEDIAIEQMPPMQNQWRNRCNAPRTHGNSRLGIH